MDSTQSLLTLMVLNHIRPETGAILKDPRLFESHLYRTLTTFLDVTLPPVVIACDVSTGGGVSLQVKRSWLETKECMAYNTLDTITDVVALVVAYIPMCDIGRLYVGMVG